MHKALAATNEGNAELHEKLQALREEKLAAVEELKAELARTQCESSKRTEANGRLKQMEQDVKALANTNDTVGRSFKPQHKYMCNLNAQAF